ncbi:colipase like 2 [Rhinolophus ferrumequinum]|uniref:Colipase like 2 n=1 Tax=Rhinolophus ferrumequinum TaxID=59479 RepID=A0A671FXN9_RHIFE|nr:colipase-like protein 2 [Rhinolophus ferrumequinum]KAF6364232.1 colipase like 2 [Rhinolophus ferrumequinum]
MAAAFLLLAGVLLPCWAAFPQVKRRATKMNGAGCAHHAECFSDCCLMDLDHGGAFCAPKTKIATVCLPQTKGAANIICPCQRGLSCISKDEMCPRRCRLI